MSDSIKHECAVSMIRLRKSPEYYVQKYGSSLYGFQKLTLLLEKQHNRGQDGAGMAGLSLNPMLGQPCFQLEKSAKKMPLADLVERIGTEISQLENTSSSPFTGELLLGHLRYGTFGSKGVSACQPIACEHLRLDRTLLMAGNFNLTNTSAIVKRLIDNGHHVSTKQDSSLIAQILEHYIIESHEKNNGNYDLAEILKKATEGFDGAFTFCGALGNGSAFALRDPSGVRPGFYYYDDEVVVVSSERPAIQTVFNRRFTEVKELPPGKALIISANGDVEFKDCLTPKPERKCVFERIYFSRGNDADIYQERLKLGEKLIPSIVKAIDSDFENTFFSYIPNTALISYYGLLRGMLNTHPNPSQLRFGQIAVKDAKFRTFISDEDARKELAMHVYDVTYGLIKRGVDKLVVIDDSIVRGSTMKTAILPILDRLEPTQIVVASSAPPIMYPDCYGIDMGSLRELIAFEATIDLLTQRNQLHIVDECYKNAKQQLTLKDEEMENCVKPIYAAISFDDLTEAIAVRLTPSGIKAKVSLIFQTCEDLAACCPNHTGDWYFTGDYPTAGGNRVVNQALVNYIEKNNKRAYQE